MTFCKTLLGDAHKEHLNAMKFVWDHNEKIALCDKQIGFLESASDCAVHDMALDELFEQKDGKL